MNSADIVIIGGGIWGLSTAFHFARRQSSQRIVLLERNDSLADETTKQAAGQIGQLRSNQVMAAGVGYTLELLQNFCEETGHDPAFQQPGSLHLALNPERMEALTAQLPSAAAMGIRAEAISKDGMRDLAPSIDLAQIEGAIHLPGDGYVDARRCALAFAQAAQDLGVQIHCGVEVNGFDFAGGKLNAVRTNQGALPTSTAVVTAGPWTRRLVDSLGFTVPMQPIRLQQARTQVDPKLSPRHPVVRIPDLSCYLRPEEGGYLFGYFDPDPVSIDLQQRPNSFRTADIPPPVEVVTSAQERLSRIFPILNQLAIQQFRQGLVTCTPDGEYVLGPLPELAGVWVATGCGAMGVAGSAPVGRWLSRWILDGDPGDDLAAFRPERFGEQARSREWLEEQARATCANYYSLAKGKTYSSASSPTTNTDVGDATPAN